MIITRTPLRISFFGGGTDYPDHFRVHGGQTLGAAIDKYSYILLKELAPLFDYTCCISYRRTELVATVADIEHPSVRECLRHRGIAGRVEVHYVGDLPARSGLGSSSSFTVGLLNALAAYQGERPGPRALAADAVHVERELIKERVGLQDQYTCAHGGLLHLRYGRDAAVEVNPVRASPERVRELESHLMLFYTGVQRMAHAVLEEQMEKTRSGAIASELARLSDLVDCGLAVLSGSGPIEEFGGILHDAWMTKRRLSTRISSGAIDDAYDGARRAGALGGKLLGAGGGGFFLFFAPPALQPAIEKALEGMPRVPIRFDTEGSKVLLHEPEAIATLPIGAPSSGPAPISPSRDGWST
jgi:D-glycero-alpha-D-manno-heptose-7-phosphate kinase